MPVNWEEFVADDDGSSPDIDWSQFEPDETAPEATTEPRPPQTIEERAAFARLADQMMAAARPVLDMAPAIRDDAQVPRVTPLEKPFDPFAPGAKISPELEAVAPWMVQATPSEVSSLAPELMIPPAPAAGPIAVPRGTPAPTIGELLPLPMQRTTPIPDISGTVESPRLQTPEDRFAEAAIMQRPITRIGTIPNAPVDVRTPEQQTREWADAEWSKQHPFATEEEVQQHIMNTGGGQTFALRLPSAPDIKDQPRTLLEHFVTGPTQALLGEKAADVQAQITRSAYNAIKSLPEFFASEDGVLTLLAGATGPVGAAATTGYFTYDTAKALMNEATRIGGEWDKMDAVEKAKALTGAAANLGISTLLGRHLIKQARGFIPKAAPQFQGPLATGEVLPARPGASPVKAKPTDAVTAAPKPDEAAVAETPVPPSAVPAAAAKVEQEVSKVARTKGQSPAQQVKNTLLDRIDEEIDGLLEESGASLEKRVEDGITYYVGSDTSGAAVRGEIEPAKGKFKATAAYSRRGAPSRERGSSTFDTIEEAERFIKSCAATGKGSVTINIPGDGIFKIDRDGAKLFELRDRARRISTKEGAVEKVGGPKMSVASDADRATRAYGSTEEAYRRVQSQKRALQSQEPPETAEEREAWNTQIEKAETLSNELYGRTKAGKLEAQAEKARDSAATYRAGAKGFEAEIERINKLKRKTSKHKLKLEDLQRSYAENQKRLSEYEKSSAEFDQQAAKEKAVLEAEAPPSEPGLRGVLPSSELPPLASGERVVTVERPDGSRYLASYSEKKSYDYTLDKNISSGLDPEIAKRMSAWAKANFGSEVIPSVGKLTEGGWSHGMLEKGSKIIEDGGASGMKAQGLEGKVGFTRRVSKPLSADEIAAHLEQQGIARGNPMVSIVDKPDSTELGTFYPSTGKIEINRSQIADVKDLQWVWDHERAHKFDVENPGAVAQVRGAVTAQEWGRIDSEVKNAGYTASEQLRERDARVITTLAESWRGRSWFERLVKRVQLWAGTNGMEMNRVAAERTAVRALAESTKALKSQKWQPKIRVESEALAGQAEGRMREEEPAEIRLARQKVLEYESGHVSAKGYADYRRAKDAVERYDQQAGETPLKGIIPRGVTDAVRKSADYLSELRQQELKAPKSNDRRMAVLHWSAKLQRSFVESSRRQREILKQVPNKVRREGITNWIQANGDRMVLQQRENATTNPKLKAGYTAALNLSPEEIAVAKSVKADYAAYEAKGAANDVLKSHKDNYVTQVWNLGKGPGGPGGGRTLKERFRFSKASTFPTFFDGEQAGYVPRTKDIAKLLPMYSHEMNSVIAAREMMEELSQGTASDGRRLTAPRGSGTQVSGAIGGATLVFPKSIKADTSDYKVLPNQPALTSWKWVSTDAAGNQVFLKADLALHPEAYAHLNNVLGRSAIREWYSKSGTALSAIPKAIVRGLDMANSETKRTMLGLLATFHQVQTGTHAIGHRVNPFFSIPKIDLVNDVAQMDAAQHGLMLAPDRVSADQFMEGFRTSGLIGHIPGLGPIADFYSSYLFHDYIPGLKYKTYQAILRRNQHLYTRDLSAGRVSMSDVKILSAEQANAAYGHINYADLGRNPTLQHIAQIFLLAPDFLEARMRFAGQAIKGVGGAKVGREQLIAVGVLAVAQAALAYTSAKITGGQWDKKRPFEFVLGNRRYTMRSVPEDLVSLATNTRQFVNNRLSPIVGRGALQYLTGVDYRGRKIGAWETTKELAGQPIPLSIRGFTGLSNTTLSSLEQLAGSLGLRISRYAANAEVYDMVREFKKQSDDPRLKAQVELQEKEVYASIYEDLRNALLKNDLPEATREYEKLRKLRKPEEIDRAMKPTTGGKEGPPKQKPFTGSAKTEKAFLKSLTPEQKAIYRKAVEQRKEFYQRFRKMLRERSENM